MTGEIDFVVTWVNGTDPDWRAQKAQYSGEGLVDDSDERYRDWGLFQYWFRGVEKFAPWVRKIHLVTWRHLPDWLNTDHPKLRIVRHEDYIPKQFLPTFNCNVLETHLHNIPGLSEQFVYFNDDMYLTKPARQEDFFRKGKPCDMLALQPVAANPDNPVMSHLFLNNSLVFCKYFDKRENMKRQPWSYFKPSYPPKYLLYNFLEMAFAKFTGLYTVHGPAPLLKSTFEELWKKEKERLNRMSENCFRTETDLSVYLMRDWQKLSGNFYPRNIQRGFRYFELGEDNRGLLKALVRCKYRIICVNDGKIMGDTRRIREELTEAFKQIFGQRSSFERS